MSHKLHIPIKLGPSPSAYSAVNSAVQSTKVLWEPIQTTEKRRWKIFCIFLTALQCVHAWCHHRIITTMLENCQVQVSLIVNFPCWYLMGDQTAWTGIMSGAHPVPHLQVVFLTSPWYTPCYTVTTTNYIYLHTIMWIGNQVKWILQSTRSTQ